MVYEHDHHRRRALAEQALDLARGRNPRTTARVLNDYQHVFLPPTGSSSDWQTR